MWGAASAAVAVSLPAFAAGTPELFAAARVGTVDGGAAWINGTLSPFALPARGHSLVRLGADVVIAGRRPGKYAAIVDPADVERPARILAPANGNVFAGHAAVAPDGAVLVTSEFDNATTKAAVILRDPASGNLRAHWDAHGIEPHDLLFARGGSRLVVAIGGLVKDGGVAGPAYNEGGIDSAIVELDAKSGRMLARHKLAPEFASLSLRHMALAPDGETVAVGMQDQDLTAVRPLMGVLRGGSLDPLEMPPGADANIFRGYIGSVAIDASGTYIAATSPRGGALGLWSLANGKWLGNLNVVDICGLVPAAQPGAFWATSGTGEILHVQAAGAGPAVIARWHAGAQFDNHLLRI